MTISWIDEKMPCGCAIRKFAPEGGYDIEYCPKHSAAPEMYKALKSEEQKGKQMERQELGKIKLRKFTKWDSQYSFLYTVSLMIEARARGYPLLRKSPQEVPPGGSFQVFINDIIDWLVAYHGEDFDLDEHAKEE